MTLTADCILNSFQSSKKRHLLLTGSQESGKSFYLKQLADDFTRGITTTVEKENGIFLTSSSGEKIQIGRYQPSIKSAKNRMEPLNDILSTQAVSILKELAGCNEKSVFIDEIGYIETGCKEYCRELLNIFDTKQVFACIRKQELDFLNNILSRKDTFTIDLDNPFGNSACVLMASGVGKRFGSNKVMADFNGNPMIYQALKQTEGIFKKRIVVTRSEETANYCKRFNVEVIKHDLPYRSDTVKLGVEGAKECEQIMFLPSDQPLLSQNTISSLALCANADKNKIWRTRHGDKASMPVIFPKEFYQELSSLPTKNGGSYVINNHPDRLRFLEVENAFELADADYPADIKKLEAYL